jgi:hypothetical protein
MRSCERRAEAPQPLLALGIRQGFCGPSTLAKFGNRYDAISGKRASKLALTFQPCALAQWARATQLHAALLNHALITSSAVRFVAASTVRMDRQSQQDASFFSGAPT